MPLQQIQLDQSIYNKQKPKWGASRQPARSPVSEALTPQQGPVGGGLAAALAAGEGATTNTFVEEQKAIWAEQDKLKKLERDAKLAKAQEIGMRVEADTQKKQEATMAQVQEQAAVKQKIEANPEEAADEMWKFYLSLPEENQKMFIDQMFTPTAPGGTLSSGGRTIPVGGQKYNAIAQNWIDKGRVMFDDKGNITVHEPEREFEKTTFKELANGDIINTATGEVIIRKGDIPKDITPDQLMEVIKQATTQTTGLVKPGYFEGLDAKGREEYLVSADKSFREYVAYILSFVHGVPTKEATRMADNLPKQDLTPPPGGGEIDEGVVTALKLLLEANPDEINNIEQYKDEYGEANVNEAWGISTPTPTPTETTPLKTSPSGFKKEKYGKYKAL